jgi:pimeloyl-ACP methyl ester carboxylesterase
MTTVTSKDGTSIGYTRTGSGPAVVLVDGALCYRGSSPNDSLAEELARHFTVYTYDRRGRGESGDTPPYDVEREYEDLAAVIEAAGGSAHVYGISSGAALSLAAANHGVPVERLAVFEAPFVVDDSRPPVPADIAERTRALVAAGERGTAVALFMRRAANLPGPVVAMMRLMPFWRRLKAVAHTLPYDYAALGDDTGLGRPLPAYRWENVTAPTLVMAGGKSPLAMQTAMRALAGVVPGAVYRTLEGQTHVVKARALAPVLTEFLTTGLTR